MHCNGKSIQRKNFNFIYKTFAINKIYVALVKKFRCTAFCWSTKRKFLSVRKIVEKVGTFANTFVKDRHTNFIYQFYYLLLVVVYTAVLSKDWLVLEHLRIIKIVIIYKRWSAKCLRFDFKTIFHYSYYQDRGFKLKLYMYIKIYMTCNMCVCVCAA